jgi:hypothetical protein
MSRNDTEKHILATLPVRYLEGTLSQAGDPHPQSSPCPRVELRHLSTIACPVDVRNPQAIKRAWIGLAA